MRKLLLLSTALLFGGLAMFGLATLAHAQGATADPVVQVTSAAQTSWDMVRQFGPVWGGMLLAYGVLSQIVKAGFWQQLVGKRAAGTVALLGVLCAVLEAHFGSGSWAGVVVTAIAAVKMLINPTVTPDPSKTGPVIPKSTLASLLVGSVLIVGSLVASCGGTSPSPVGPVITGTIDCTIDNGGKIAALIESMKPQPGHSIDWSVVYQKAKDAGAAIGGCALIQLAQMYLSDPQYAATAGSATWTGLDYAEKFRHEEAHDAVFHTKYGDL